MAVPSTPISLPAVCDGTAPCSSRPSPEVRRDGFMCCDVDVVGGDRVTLIHCRSRDGDVQELVVGGVVHGVGWLWQGTHTDCKLESSSVPPSGWSDEATWVAVPMQRGPRGGKERRVRVLDERPLVGY